MKGNFEQILWYSAIIEELNKTIAKLNKNFNPVETDPTPYRNDLIEIKKKISEEVCRLQKK